MKNRKWFIAVGGALLLATGLGVLVSRPTHLQPLDSSSPAVHYLDEFRAARYSEVPSPIAPDGSARVEDSLGWLPMSWARGCHMLWFVPRRGWRRMILKARESDPGSGRSFGWAWSLDSKAIFVRGSHFGLDCRGADRGELHVVYTVSDAIAWEVPPAPRP